MKPDTPSRASSRIKAKSSPKIDTSLNKNGDGPDAAHISANISSRGAAPQAYSPEKASFTLRGGAKQSSVGVPPKLSSSSGLQQSRPNSGGLSASSAAASHGFHPPPHVPHPKKSLTAPSHGFAIPQETHDVHSAQPTLEERKRAARAYALQGSTSKGGSKTRGKSTNPAMATVIGAAELPVVVTSADPPKKRGPGRPRKSPAPAFMQSRGGGVGTNSTTSPGSNGSNNPPVKRKVGRPRKTPMYHPDSPQGQALAAQAKHVEGAQRTRAIVEGRLHEHTAKNANPQRMDSNATEDAANDLTDLSRGLNQEYSNDGAQSLPNSNADLDNDEKGTKFAIRSSSRIKASPRHATKKKNSSSSQSSNKYNPLPLQSASTDMSIYGEDDEYARFMRSLMSDDQSIITFKTLKSIKSSTSATTNQSKSVVGSAFETMDEDDVSYQLTSEEEDEDEEMGDDSQAAPESPYKMGQPPSPLPHQNANDEELLNVFGEIEGLMEEDIEAAVMASLIGEGDDHAGPNTWGYVSGMGGGKPTSGGKRAKEGGTKTKVIAKGPANLGAIMGSSQQRTITTPGYTTKKQRSTTTVVTTPIPLGGRSKDSRAIEVPAVSRDQLARLGQMMANHHQLLLQQATLSVRAAYAQKAQKAMNTSPSPVNSSSKRPKKGVTSKSLTFSESRPHTDCVCSYSNDFFGGETPEELSECLDGAVGMLQDLQQNWKDAVRNSIQLRPSAPPPTTSSSSVILSPARNQSADGTSGEDDTRRLTRSAFTRTLLEQELEKETSNDNNKPPSPTKHALSSSTTAHGPQQRTSIFNIRGLAHLKETFSALDNSVKDVQMGRGLAYYLRENEDEINILAPEKHGKACEILLQHVGAEINQEYLLPPPDLGATLTHAPEVFDDPDKVTIPLTKKQEFELRKNRHSFTAGEDNLILRGVNLYGEKEWCLVSDRFLPDRVVNSISQRYNKLCFLIYKANGIEIDDKGNMLPIPDIIKGQPFDISKLHDVMSARAPTTMNVHRWTLEEDIAILKAVPVMGNAWAEIATRLMPHRDRGHIRKRFQVLQRRIPKGITKINVNYLKRAVALAKSLDRPSKRLKPSSPVRRTLSSAKKRTRSKKNTSPTKESMTRALNAAASPADLFLQAAAQVDRRKAPSSKIFQQAVAAQKRPPVSPIKNAYSSNTAAQALFQAVEHEVDRAHSPETTGVASVLASGFSQDSSNPLDDYDEDTKMGVEKILGNDDWSQASGMQRLIEAGAADSNFPPEKGHNEMNKGYKAKGSLLSNVMENSNARKRKSSAAFPPSTPMQQVVPAGRKNEYPSSIPTSAISFNLETPGKGETMGSLGAAPVGELTMDTEFFECMMSDKSRQTGEGATFSTDAAYTSSKTGMMMSPIKVGKAPSGLSQLGVHSLAGHIDGGNSLFMQGSDMQASEFDAVAALQNLSNSVPNTPAKDMAVAASLNQNQAAGNEAAAVEVAESKKKRPKISFLGQVKAKIAERKSRTPPK